MSIANYPYIMVATPQEQPIKTLDPTKMIKCTTKEQINGEHSLEIVTKEPLEKEQRILFRRDDAKGNMQLQYKEFVVTEVVQTHDYYSAYCVWSLQHDLMCTKVSSMPGVRNPVSARVALEAALAGTGRWKAGTVDVDTMSGGSMYHMSGWDALKVVLEKWGGEIETYIQFGYPWIRNRSVALVKQLSQSGFSGHRFEYSRDMSGVTRTVSDDLITCRIIPYGKGEETEGGGYGRRIDITSVNSGVEWIEDPDVVNKLRLPNGEGGYEYPTQIVIFGDIETPAELLTYARAHIKEYTTPKITYSATVASLQDTSASLSALQYMKLGDMVQCVDAEVNGLRIQSRIVSIEANELDRTDTKIQIDTVAKTLADQFK